MSHFSWSSVGGVRWRVSFGDNDPGTYWKFLWEECIFPYAHIYARPYLSLFSWCFVLGLCRCVVVDPSKVCHLRVQSGFTWLGLRGSFPELRYEKFSRRAQDYVGPWLSVDLLVKVRELWRSETRIHVTPQKVRPILCRQRSSRFPSIRKGFPELEDSSECLLFHISSLGLVY